MAVADAPGTTKQDPAPKKELPPREKALEKIEKANHFLDHLSVNIRVHESFLKEALDCYDEALAAFEQQDYDLAFRKAAEANKRAYDSLPGTTQQILQDLETKLSELLPARRGRVETHVRSAKQALESFNSQDETKKGLIYDAVRAIFLARSTYEFEMSSQQHDQAANKAALTQFARRRRS